MQRILVVLVEEMGDSDEMYLKCLVREGRVAPIGPPIFSRQALARFRTKPCERLLAQGKCDFQERDPEVEGGRTWRIIPLDVSS